jgi:phage shock protein PspC (stress-responsive transcriptional regulator)
MQKVISINLNGNAYQVEDGGYATLTAYLDAAQRQLRDNPDRDEIVADLEQAIAEKCRRYLTAHKTVVTAAEVDTLIKEMGPVDGGASSSSDDAASEATRDAAAAPRRLYRISDGAMIAGVCNGIGAYFHVDATIVRVIFVGLLFLTKGAFGIVYLVLAFVLPQANTSEERAAARGERFSAQELIDRAKKHYADHSGDWRRLWRRDRSASRMQWRRSMREARREWRDGVHDWGWAGAGMYGRPQAGYGARVFAGMMVPLLTLVSVALFWLMLFTIFSLVTRQEVFGALLPDDVPLWVGIIVVVIAYKAVAWPLHMLRRSSYYVIGGAYHGTVATLDGLLSLAFVVFGIWLAFNYLPAVREILQQIPEVVRSFADSVT